MKRWTKQTVFEEIKKYTYINQFRLGSSGAYDAAERLEIIKEIRSLLSYKHKRWTETELKLEASKYKTRKEFKLLGRKAYQVAFQRGILNEICLHMPKDSKIGNKPFNFKWSPKKIQEEALRYKTRSEFKENSEGAYDAAKESKILDIVCDHMKKPSNSSSYEIELFNRIKVFYPTAVKLRQRKIFIPHKPWIKGFDIDVYIPELNKGIELDGEYWHSFEGMKRTKKGWPDEDIKNYMAIKDTYFLSQGIALYHISDRDWLKNKNQSLQKALDFLGKKE